METKLKEVLKEDIVNNTESIKYDFTDGFDDGAEAYLKDYFANHSEFDDSQESFDEHIGYVRDLFNKYVYGQD